MLLVASRKEIILLPQGNKAKNGCALGKFKALAKSWHGLGTPSHFFAKKPKCGMVTFQVGYGKERDNRVGREEAPLAQTVLRLKRGVTAQELTS
jgi:hypothetical protein